MRAEDWDEELDEEEEFKDWGEGENDFWGGEEE